MMPAQEKYVLTLAGAVRLTRPDGRDITPRAAKLRAILVLLATGKDMRRPRAFLQDMLWSEAGPERGGASLRQALSGARKLSEGDGDLVLIDPTSVALNPDKLRVDLSLPLDCVETPEFAEGLDIADPEFEDWLRDRRLEFADACEKVRRDAPAAMAVAARVKASAAAAKAAATRMQPAVLACPPVFDDPALQTHAEMLTADVATHIAQLGEAEVLLDPRAARAGDNLAVQVRATRSDGQIRFQVQLGETAVPRILWLGEVSCPAQSGLHAATGLDRLLVDAAAAASAHFGRLGPEGALDHGHLAFQMFAHFPFQDGPRLRRFEAWFDQHTNSPEARATQLAWRARLRLVTLLEHGNKDPNAFGEAQEFSRAAISLTSGDPMVSAIAADVALHVDNRVELACELARTSAVQRPRNPFIQAIYAQALGRAERPREGYAAAQRALALAAGQPNLSWWHAICSATAIRLREFDAARKHAELAHFLAPTFRPPLRFLGALRFHAGDEAGAAEALGALKALEPDFCLERMADASYPVASLRGTKLLEVAESGLL